jgi:hypothetical protein
MGLQVAIFKETQIFSTFRLSKCGGQSCLPFFQGLKRRQKRPELWVVALATAHGLPVRESA